MNPYLNDEISNFYTLGLKYRQTRKPDIFSNIQRKRNKDYKDHNETSRETKQNNTTLGY